jgi:hypothetical protein
MEALWLLILPSNSLGVAFVVFGQVLTFVVLVVKKYVAIINCLRTMCNQKEIFNPMRRKP